MLITEVDLRIDFEHLDDLDEVFSKFGSQWPQGMAVSNWTLMSQWKFLSDPIGRLLVSPFVLLGVIPLVPPQRPATLREGTNLRGLNLTYWTLRGVVRGCDFRDTIPPAAVTNSFKALDCQFSRLTIDEWRRVTDDSSLTAL